MLVLNILKILGIIIFIIIAYFGIVLFLGHFIFIPLCWLFGQIKARIFWRMERPNVCRQLKETGLTDEEIEQLAPKDFKTFFNMESEDYDAILEQAEKRMDREAMDSIIADICNKKDETIMEAEASTEECFYGYPVK